MARPLIFNTWVYGLFLAVVFVAYWGAPTRARPAVLTAVGLFFYWYYFPPHLLLIVALTLGVLVVGRRVAPDAGPGRRAWLAIGVGGCVALLVYYKYQGLLADAVGWVVGRSDVLRPPQLRAPLGISFFTFEFVHYLVEVSRGTFPPARLGEFALFALFFPTLICGPIKRFGDFRSQEHAAQPLDGADVNAGLERIVVGLAKKTLVADVVARSTAAVFGQPEAYTWAQLWLAVYGYAFQIYCDFAGYSDIAIGSARLLGYRVPENFDWPYLQPNIARFWRSWHMSLTSWITDYLYIPLGGSRRGEWRGYANRLVSMTICGLWHGAAFHFAVWGMYHGLALNLFRVWERWRGPRADSRPVARVVSTLVTFHVVCIGWVLFVCDLDRAWVVIGRLLLLRSR